MTKKFTEVQVQVDELALSILGWEVQDFRARATSTPGYDRGEWDHNLAISGVFRFNDYDWTDRFGRRPPSPVMTLRSPVLSDWPGILSLDVKTPKSGGSARVSANCQFLESDRAIDHSDLRIELTGYDSIDISDFPDALIPLDVKAIASDVVDESTTQGARIEIDQLDAFTHHRYCRDQSERYGEVRMSGRVVFGSREELLADYTSGWPPESGGRIKVKDRAPFETGVPNVVFEILDDTGFLLEQINGRISIYVPVDENGRTPARTPRWLIDSFFWPDSYSATPTRVIARIGG